MSVKFSNKFAAALFFAAFLIFASVVSAQTSAFTFQGKLNDGGTPASGTYQFEFKLYDANGSQIGNTLSGIPVIVTNGIFAVSLDFGANSFDGTTRTIEIGVRLNGGGQNYTVLSPRQPIASTPYAVKSLSATSATTATTATNSLNLGGVAAAQYTQTSDPRLSDARTPTPNSTYYIQNGTNQQQSSSFNISGEGMANVFNATINYKIGGSRVFHLTGAYNTLVGFESGDSIAGGGFNAFFGTFAGKSTTTGNNNAFFGSYAGQNNLAGSENSFFGQGAGLKNTNGAGNSLYGYGAGLNNTTGTNNTFVGFVAGQSNTIEDYNTFLGYRANGAAGITNSTAIGANAVVTTSNTMVLGTNAVTVKIPGILNVAGTFSANAFDSTTVYKIGGNRVFHLTGTDNTSIGFESGNSFTTGGFNAFFGTFAGKSTTTGNNNAFFGSYAGRDNITGGNNAFFGANAGLSNNSSFNAFFGSGAGLSNVNGANNSYFGNQSGTNNSTGDNNSFFGSNAGKSTDNSSFNSFFGSFSGEKTTSGAGNTFVGALAGRENTIGFNNTIIGYKAGQTPTTGNSNVIIGYNASFTSGVSNSIAIGANVSVGASNSIIIGTGAQTTYLPGGVNTSEISANQIYASNKITANEGNINYVTADRIKINPAPPGLFGEASEFNDANFSGVIQTDGLKVGNKFTGGSTPLCGNGSPTYFAVVICSSSIRYKDNVRDFTRGFELINKLRPVTFTWKTTGSADVGFVAEEINSAEPLLTIYNDKGEIEGVKYAQITTALVNAVKEQQTQIEKQSEQIKQQQAQIDALKTLICSQNQVAVCQPQNK